MKRAEIEEKFKDVFAEHPELAKEISDLLGNIESTFEEIGDLLDGFDIDNLDNAVVARRLANEAVRDLFCGLVLLLRRNT